MAIMQHLGKALAAVALLVLGAILNYEVPAILQKQEKAGHDIGSLGRMIASAPGQFWVFTGFVGLLVVYVFWPSIKRWIVSSDRTRPLVRGRDAEGRILFAPENETPEEALERFQQVAARELEAVAQSRDKAERESNDARQEADALKQQRDAAQQQRDAAQQQRDDARRQLSLCESELSSHAQPPLSGCIRTFEKFDFKDVPNEWHTQPIPSAIRYITEGFRYAVHLQIDTGATATRLTEWRFSLRTKDDKEATCEPDTRTFNVPASWPTIQYVGLDAVQNDYLQPNRVYNVFFYVKSNALWATLDGATFTIECRATNGSDVAFSKIVLANG